ncbi:unnamed protein product [Haemonchus placei]|uniref:HTH_48 domain-containing protein n=1 Tax=Haemonchus placei TaxID=6290 RepID=A0A0N4W2Z4_HAEPC|nr:unnamed protein product [Haemonchus placei]
MSVSQGHLRATILYEWRCGTGATATFHNINSALGENTTSIAIIRRWFIRFKEGDTGFEDKPRSERPLAIDDSVILDTVTMIRKFTPAALRRDMGVPKSIVVGRRQALGYISADSMDTSCLDR